MSTEEDRWPSVVVACVVLAVIAAIGITAIMQYTADDALKIWSALAALLGGVIGSFTVYFFSRSDAEKAKGFTKLVSKLDADNLDALKSGDPLLSRLL